MTDTSLTALLDAIEPSTRDAGEGTFRVIAIPGCDRHYVGWNTQGHPCLLLGSEPGAFYAPVRLALLEAHFGNLHRIHPVNGAQREELLSVITCTSQDMQAQTYFLHVCETILRIVGAQPTLNAVVQSVQRLIEIFRSLSRPPKRSLNGLAGELFLIAASRNPAASVAAWRSSDVDRFDFSSGNVRLDVKASAERLRIHHLSAEQCQPPSGTVGLLASVFIEASGGGQSLRELVEQIETLLVGDANLILKVQQTVAETLGDGLASALAARFDDRLAITSLRFFDLATVPAIRDGIPAEVSGVHFRSDLSQTNQMEEREIGKVAELALNFLPR
ncbi:PD-(D/E)XK motif protein [Qipengyuania oceanensis]|uniref:PD-(D/E)XK motif protein n=1 Tax=Qipengyuania oceanensis TaxID=1463597 RepID=A0A844YAX4_9SPHN|nr:PD-(D/E)XK motif protein [Qipengyuania oceanensis]MXO61391.1 PD-(D/E)XK motif protein [Qipengyuania oceanensis]